MSNGIYFVTCILVAVLWIMLIGIWNESRLLVKVYGLNSYKQYGMALFATVIVMFITITVLSA